MENNQKKLLLELSDKLRNQKRTESDVKTTLFNAGILNKEGNFTNNYKNLEVE